jgi:4-hydroxybenzoate polyprenyltransferase
VRAITAWLRLTRIENGIAAALATLVGSRLAEGSETVTSAVITAAAVAGLGVMAANTVNDVCDREADGINKPHRPLPSRRVSLMAARTTAKVLTGFALVAAASLGPLHAFQATLLIALGLLYSVRLKSTVLVGNTVVGALAASTVLFGSAVAGRVSSASWVAATTLFLFVAAGEVLKSVEDRDGDQASGYRTIATLLSPRACLMIYQLLAGCFIGVALLPIASHSAPAPYAAVVLSTAVLPTAALMVFLNVRGDQRAVTVSIAATKMVWFTGLGALCLLR